MMNTRNRILIFSAVLMVTISLCAGFAQLPGDEDFPGEVQEKNYLQQMIELVVEANPTLQSQRSLIMEIETVPEPVKGLDFTLGLKTGAALESDDEWERRIEPTGSLEVTIPLYSSAKKRKIALENLTTQKDLTKARQDYYQLKNSVISDLLSRVDKLISLKNDLDGQKNLLSLFQYNLEALQKQVEAGIASPSDLWSISERVMATETKIATLLSRIDINKRETAVNLAGTSWPELMEMLNQIGRQTQPQE